MLTLEMISVCERGINFHHLKQEYLNHFMRIFGRNFLTFFPFGGISRTEVKV